MKIKYKIKIVNPRKDLLSVTGDDQSTGSFTVSKNKIGIVVKGSLLKNNIEKKAYSYSYVGEESRMTIVDTKKELYKDTYHAARVEDVFKVLGASIDSKEFMKINPFYRRIVNKELDIFIDKAEDVIIVRIDKAGIVSRADTTPIPRSNKVIIKDDLNRYVLGYYLVSKPLYVETNDSLFINNSELLNLPFGFCTLTNKELIIKDERLESIQDSFVYTSPRDTTVTFSSETLVDGVPCYQYKYKKNEDVLLDSSDNFEEVSFSNLEGNTVLIYEVLQDSSKTPLLAISSVEGSEDKALLTLYEQLKNADKEFLKKYIMKELKINMKTDRRTFHILNKNVLDLMNKEFKGNVLKI